MATKQSFANGIWECVHCGERMGTARKFCKFCETAEGRRNVDKQNEEAWAAQGKVYKCKMCTTGKAGDKK